MDTRALFTLQCGLFVAAVGLGDKLNGCVTNTLLQQSHAPVKLSLTVDKTHLTHDMIMEKKTVAVSVLSTGVTEATIRRFGYSSGRDTEKFAGISYTLDENENPLLEGAEVAARFSLQVYDGVDMGTHTMFLCIPTSMEDTGIKSVTYMNYQETIKNKISEKRSDVMKKYVCTICGYIYNPEKGDPDHGIAPGTKFEDIPDDFVCPVCGVGKDMFEAQ